jgi:hypothetical protein
MDLIPIHANPERDWCKRTKPKGVSRPAHDLVEPAHGRVGMADLPLPSRADWSMGTLRKDPALALAGLGVANERVALAHVWLGHVHPVGARRCLGSRAPRSARRRPAHLAHSSRPAPGISIQLPSWPPRTSASRHPRTRRPESWGRQTHPQPNAGAAPLARSFAIRPSSCRAGAGKAKGCTALRRIASRLHCQCQVG